MKKRMKIKALNKNIILIILVAISWIITIIFIYISFYLVTNAVPKNTGNEEENIPKTFNIPFEIPQQQDENVETNGVIISWHY